MKINMLIAPLVGLVTCFLTTYFRTNTTVINALTIAFITSVTVLVVGVIVERAKRMSQARLNKRVSTGDQKH